MAHARQQKGPHGGPFHISDTEKAGGTFYGKRCIPLLAAAGREPGGPRPAGA